MQRSQQEEKKPAHIGCTLLALCNFEIVEIINFERKKYLFKATN